MCGHFAINYMRLKNLVEKYGLEHIPPEELDKLFSTQDFFPARGESQSKVPVILEDNGVRKINLFRWDIIPSWWNKPLKEKKFSTFNARYETLTEKASYKSAWKKGQRCIIPATSFFEWPDKKLAPKDQKRVEKRIQLLDQEIFSFAALWDICTLPGNDQIFSCTLITIEANETLLQIPHTRMPVILKDNDQDIWLSKTTSPDEAFKLLQQYPADQMQIL